LTVALCLSSTAAAAATADDAVVVRVQDLHATAAEVTRRMAALGPGQAATLGTPRQFVETVVAPELAYSLEAKKRGLDQTPGYRERERVILRQALDAALKAEAVASKPVTTEELKAYYDANKSRFEQPLAVRLWRILVDDEATAKRLLEQVRGSTSPAKWSELARDNSLDKATNLRQGDLGFVQADGATDVPRVRVAATLFQAAQAVKDGEVVPQPVREGSKFAVVWRRGSRAEKARSLEQEQDSIRALLERQRSELARSTLVASLREKSLREEHPELLDQLPEGLFGNKLARPRPTLSAPRTRGFKPPVPTDQGLR
jgi:peptidyl-prolyl cis-trans isomerase C